MSPASVIYPAAKAWALERDALVHRELMDPHKQTVPRQPPDVEALRRTARSAVEDWLELRQGVVLGGTPAPEQAESSRTTSKTPPGGTGQEASER